MKNMGLVILMAALFVSGSAGAGAQAGPKTHRDTVAANSRDAYIITFVREKPAIILVKGDGSTDIDCVVYDNNENRVAQDLAGTDMCTLQWTPAWTGKFKLMIINRGNTDNEYVSVTN